jgi:hypothetical protein
LQYHLRTLLVVLTFGPPVLAGLWTLFGNSKAAQDRQRYEAVNERERQQLHFARYMQEDLSDIASFEQQRGVE